MCIYIYTHICIYTYTYVYPSPKVTDVLVHSMVEKARALESLDSVNDSVLSLGEGSSIQ